MTTALALGPRTPARLARDVLGLFKLQLRVEVGGEALRKTGLADADRAFDDDVASCGEGVACDHQMRGSGAGSAFDKQAVRSGGTILRHSFEALQHAHAGRFHLLDGVYPDAEVACPA